MRCSSQQQSSEPCALLQTASDRTFLPVSHAQHCYGASLGWRWEAMGSCLLGGLLRRTGCGEMAADAARYWRRAVREKHRARKNSREKMRAKCGPARCLRLARGPDRRLIRRARVRPPRAALHRPALLRAAVRPPPLSACSKSAAVK